MELKVLTKDEIYEEISEDIVKLINEKHNAVLGLATGSSPVGVYQKLIEKYADKKVSFKDVITYNLDEYVGLTKDNDQSYYYFMMNQLFKHVDINLANVHVPDGIETEKCIETYESNMVKDGGIDYQILGIGSNGHIAFNEPGTPLDSHIHIVTLKDSTRKDNARFFASIDEVPTHAITMGLKSILAGKRIVLIATGKNKALAIKRLFEEGETTDLPASVLKEHPNVTIYCDEDAASLLEKVGA